MARLMSGEFVSVQFAVFSSLFAVSCPIAVTVTSITAGSGAFEDGAKSVQSPELALTGLMVMPTTLRASNSSPACPVAMFANKFPAARFENVWLLSRK